MTWVAIGCLRAFDAYQREGRRPMKPSDAPRGSVIAVGHPANEILYVKGSDGEWRSVDDGRLLDPENFRAGWDVWNA